MSLADGYPPSAFVLIFIPTAQNHQAVSFPFGDDVRAADALLAAYHFMALWQSPFRQANYVKLEIASLEEHQDRRGKHPRNDTRTVEKLFFIYEASIMALLKMRMVLRRRLPLHEYLHQSKG